MAGRRAGAKTSPRRHGVGRALAVGAAVAVTGLVAGACGSGGAASSSGSTPGQPSGKPVDGGTVRWAEQPGTPPTYTFPLASLTDFTVANQDEFEQLMYRPLYFFGTNGSPTVDLTKSIGREPAFGDGDRSVTITLNDYRWSDGEKVDARDVIFWMNLLKAEKSNWGDYVPGYFPDNVRSMSMPAGPTGDTVAFQLTGPVNPTWFLYNELSQITPLPLAWDKTSAGSPTPTATSTDLPDATTAGAKSVYDFLNGQSKALDTYGSNPLWAVVDGPWKLQSFSVQGQATFVPNKRYVGPDRPHLAKFIEVPYLSDNAEYNSVKAGTGYVQVGYVPSQDLPSLGSVESEGYSAFRFYPFSYNYLPLNFDSSSDGAAFRQLYVRRALQELINQPGWIKAYYQGLAAPTYGPVPIEPSNPFADSVEKSDPYPYSPSSAAKLLSAHGWDVKKGGTTTCADPSRCGAGISKGQALSITMEYASGSLPLTDSMNDFKSEAATIGIQVTTVQQAFTAVIGDDVTGGKSWEMVNWGGGWTYGPDYYASGEEFFLAGAGDNSGSYSNPTANRLIDATTSIGASGSRPALDSYEDFVARQLPVLFQPAPASEDVVARDLGGTVLRPDAFDVIDPESWYYVSR